jgi:hypothetical protein
MREFPKQSFFMCLMLKLPPFAGLREVWFSAMTEIEPSHHSHKQNGDVATILPEIVRPGL